MPHPTKQALLDWARNYPELWNAGDKQAWIAAPCGGKRAGKRRFAPAHRSGHEVYGGAVKNTFQQYFKDHLDPPQNRLEQEEVSGVVTEMFR